MLLNIQSPDPAEKQHELLSLRDELTSLQESLIQVPEKDYKYFAGSDLYLHIVEVAKSLYDGEVTREELKEAGLIEQGLLIQNLLDDLDFYFSKPRNARTFPHLKTPPAELVVDKLITDQKMSPEEWTKTKEGLLEVLQL